MFFSWQQKWELVCYSDSLLSINLITGQASKYHAYVILVQDIKDLLSSRNFSIQHSVREEIQCADFMAKLRDVVVDLRSWSIFPSRSQVRFTLMSISGDKFIQNFALTLNESPASGRWDWFPKISLSCNPKFGCEVCTT